MNRNLFLLESIVANAKLQTLSYAINWRVRPRLAWVISPFSASPVFGQVQKFFFLENLLLERYIKRHFFLAKTLNFFSYSSEKTGKSSHR